MAPATEAVAPSYAPLPRFFAKPRKDQLRISPGGTYLGWRARDETTGALNIWVQKRAATAASAPSSPPRQITFATDRDACLLFRFTSDDRTVLYLRESRHGSELYHLHAVDLDDADSDGADYPRSGDDPPPRNLIGDPTITCAVGFIGGVQLWLDPCRPRIVHVATAKSGPLSLFWDVSSVDVDTGERVVVARNELSTWPGLIVFVLRSLLCLVARFVTGGRIRLATPRAAIQWFPDRGMRFRGRMEAGVVDLSAAFCIQSPSPMDDSSSRPPRPSWKTLHTVEWIDVNMSLIGSSGGSGTARADFSEDGSTVDLHLCHLDGECDTTSYERFDVRTGRHMRRLASNDHSDITGFVAHPRSGRVQCVTYEYEMPTIECLKTHDSETGEDAALTRDVSFLRETFGDGVSIASRTLNDDIWVVYAESAKGLELCSGSPSGYFIFKRQEQELRNNVKSGATLSPPRFQLAAIPRPELSGHSLGDMIPVHIKARDGEDLLCYLSTPPDFKPSDESGGSRPLVVFIHGGPQARDTYRYHPVCQLLCSRGMSVLQVNYRGSTGMGTRFMRLGMDGAFSNAMQHDIIDAARHAVAAGWADSDRLAIMGASFGGYSSLHAMTFEPGLFRCAVAICPISAVGAANSSGAFHGSPLVARYWRGVFGEAVWKDEVAAKRASPLFHVGNIKGPVLILHGEDDPRAPLEHSTRIAEEMSRRGIPGEFVTFAGEGHAVAKERNVLYMYSRVEQFLCSHLGIDAPPLLEDVWTRGNSASIRISSEVNKALCTSDGLRKNGSDSGRKGEKQKSH